ncbi:MAG: UbiA family prenyltransferase [Bacteroidales bacterium]|nr:UbiA family prenyltransferase [Bacteroidales bacterium]
MPRYPQLLAYAQLLRLPNVFTAFADIGMAGVVTGAIIHNTNAWLIIMLSSGCLYLSGMIWNDIFDRHEDAKTQSFRPIPSGRVRLRHAVALGVAFMALGLTLSSLSQEFTSDFGHTAPPGGQPHSLSIALSLSLSILLYDVYFKWTPVGPVCMGFCRFLNVLLGMSVGGVPILADPLYVHLASVVGLYIVGVTWFARTEEVDSNRIHLLLASSVMALSLMLAVILPVHLPLGKTAWLFLYLLVLFGFRIGIPIASAIRRRDPKSVQVAVKRCILGLVALDAVLATAFIGWPGLSILLLLIPARFLGRWVYST